MVLLFAVLESADVWLEVVEDVFSAEIISYLVIATLHYNAHFQL